MCSWVFKGEHTQSMLTWTFSVITVIMRGEEGAYYTGFVPFKTCIACIIEIYFSDFSKHEKLK